MNSTANLIRQMEWISQSNLIGLPGIPNTRTGVNIWGKNKPRKKAKEIGSQGKDWMYPIHCLPVETQNYLKAQATLALYEQSPEARLGREAAKQLQAEEAQQKAAKTQDAEALLALFSQATGEKGNRAKAWLAVFNEWKRFYVTGFPTQKCKKTYSIEVFVKAFNNRDPRINLDNSVYQSIEKTTGRGRCANGNGLSVRTLKRKISMVEKSGIGSLVDGYANKNKGKNTINQQPALEHFVLGLMAQQPAVKAIRLYELASNHFKDRLDIKIPSEFAFSRYLEQWKKDHASAHIFINSPDDWKNRAMPAVGKADGDVIRLNQRWELDSTLGDLLLADGKRHALIGVIDVYSRRGKLMVAPTSKARAIGALMRNALLDWGIPEEAKTDNGADYKSDYFTGVLFSLGIEQTLCPPFSPEYKPHIERFLGTFNHDLVELLPGYIGHDVAERKDIEARRSFAQRLMQKDGVLEIRKTPEEFQAFCNDWVENRYHHRAHEGLNGVMPFQKAASYQDSIRRITNERALDILLSPSVDGKTRTLKKKGLEINGGFYSAPELWSHLQPGASVEIRMDESDLGQVYVFDVEGRFVCVAVCPERKGLNPEEVKKHAMTCKQAAKRTLQKDLKTLNQAKETVNLSEQVDSFLKSKAQDAAKLSAFPQRSETHSTEALEAAQQAADFVDGKRLSQPLPDDLAEAVKKRQQEKSVSKTAPSNVSFLPEKPQAKYQLWKELDKRLQRGDGLREEEYRFFKSFIHTPEYRAMKRKEESNAALLAQGDIIGNGGSVSPLNN